MAKSYKLRYINKIMLFFELQKEGDSTPETPPGSATAQNPINFSYRFCAILKNELFCKKIDEFRQKAY